MISQNDKGGEEKKKETNQSVFLISMNKSMMTGWLIMLNPEEDDVT